MKKLLKHWGILLVAIALVVVVGKYTIDHHLKAADEEGTHNAETEQAQVMEAQNTVNVVLPAADQPQETAQAAPAATNVPNVSLYVYVNGGNNGFYYGDTVELLASISGEEYLSNYNISWEYHDGEDWFSTGVTGDSYSFTVNSKNAGYGYRATMTYNFK